MVCGYKALKKKQDYETKRLYQESLKKRALNYFKFSSLVPDKTLFDKHLSNYAVVDQETKRALEIAKRSVNEMLLNKPIHVVLTGKSGVGKAIWLWELRGMFLSDHTIKKYFVRELSGIVRTNSIFLQQR